MSHVDDGTLNALLDGELESAEAAAAQAHIAGCAECAKRLDDAKRFLTEAADLLGALDGPRPAAAPESGAQVRRVSKTAKEVALDLDGATQQSPAIGADLSDRLFRRGPRAQREHRRLDYSSLGWAAMVVLAIGVGYLANEVRHARGAAAVGERSATARPGTAAGAATVAAGADKAAPVTPAREAVAGGAGNKRLPESARPYGPAAAKAPPGAARP